MRACAVFLALVVCALFASQQAEALRTLTLAIFASVFSCASEAEACYGTSIKAPVPYMGNGGEIVVMMDGTIWQD